MAQATVAADFHKALNVLRNLAMEVALDGEVLVDVFADFLEIVLGDVLHADIRVDASLSDNLFCGGVADTVDVSQADLNALLAREVDTKKTCHSLASLPLLTLTLLMTGVLADHEHLAMASNDFALVAHFLDRRTDLHFRLLRMCGFPWPTVQP